MRRMLTMAALALWALQTGAQAQSFDGASFGGGDGALGARANDFHPRTDWASVLADAPGDAELAPGFDPNATGAEAPAATYETRQGPREVWSIDRGRFYNEDPALKDGAGPQSEEYRGLRIRRPRLLGQPD